MPHRTSSSAQPEDRDGFRFRAGNLALDLTATLAGRLKPEPRELLETRADLGRWLKSAGLCETAPQATEEDLDQARRLREAIYTLALARAEGKDAAASARSILNRITVEAPATPSLDRNGRMRLEGSARSFLSTLAREAVSVLGGPDAPRIKQCESEACSLLFVDLSRSGERRWCSMSSCGNKAKVAEFRRRARKS